jgi:cephalosporin hydroxylase
MNQLGNAVTFSGLLLAVMSLFSLSARYVEPSWAVLGTAADEALTISAILVLIAVLLRFSSNPSTSTDRVVPRQLRILLWIGGIFIVSVSSCQVTNNLTRPSEQTIVQEFQKLYHKNITFDSHFLGVQSIQFPADNWVMQEIITETRPEVIIETGTAKGGTTLFYATLLEQLKGGRIITVDIDDHDPAVIEFAPWRERVQFIKGSSVSPDVFEQIKGQVNGRRVLVTLDSEHTKEHVLKELELYSTLVPVNGYLVVQDTHLNGHPVPWPRLEKTGGPMEAVQEFLKTHKNFEVDRSREKHLVTQNPSGFLKRVS